MTRLLLALIAVTLLGGCQNSEPAPPADQGNVKEGRPAESAAGKALQEAQKVQEKVNARPDDVDKSTRDDTK